MNKFFLLTITCILVLTSCSDETIPPRDLIGKWNWINSSGGIAGAIYTPENTGDTIVLEFTRDSVYKLFRNDSLVTNCEFSIVKAESIYNHEITDMIDCDGYMRRSFSFTASGDLILADEFYDGFTSEYERME